jgi:hypothetical protein
MLQKKDIETILKINGVSIGAPDEEIRSVLLSARYNNDEVDTAIMVLRENILTHKTRVDGLHKVFRSDQALNPSEISALLGIEVEVSDITQLKNRKREMSILQTTLVTFFAVGLAVIGVVLAMYVYQVGVFHPSVALLGTK